MTNLHHASSLMLGYFNMKFIARLFLLWLPMVLLGILNGILRELLIKPFTSDFLAHQLSSFSLILFLFIYIRIIFNRLRIKNISSAWLIGLFWMLLTTAFEFGMGYWISHLSWHQMLDDYNIFKGRLWPIVLLSLLLIPVVLYKMNHRLIRRNG